MLLSQAAPKQLRPNPMKGIIMVAPYNPDRLMLKFWETDLVPIFAPLINGNSPLKEIQAIYHANMAAFQQQYGGMLDIALSDKSPRDSIGQDGALPMGCSLVNGRPKLTFFIPEIRKVFNRIRQIRRTDYRSVFETVCIISLMHELDHIALNRIGNRADATTNADDERVVWARTCELTMKILSESYGWDFVGGDSEIYSTWVACGRNVESERWKKFITKLYGQLKRG